MVEGIIGATVWRTVGTNMLGIDDVFVSLAYLLCICSSVLCIAWGTWNWNRGDETTEPADVKWAAREDQNVSEL